MMKNNSQINDVNKTCHIIQDWFVKNHNLNLDIEERFIEKGVLDSFEIINLILFIEESFNIKFSTDNFSRPEFFTIKGLASLVVVNK